MRRLPRNKRPGLLADTRGVSLVEFAFLAPVFCLILAGAIDLGGMLYTRYGLDAAVSAGANYAVVNGAQVSSTNGAALATTLAAIVSSSEASNWANSTIIVNNGPTATTTAGQTVMSGTPANADSCYCPTLIPSGVYWGGVTPCGQSCGSNQGIAGKFVYVTANKTYSPFFGNDGFIKNWTVSINAMVQAQ